MILYTLGKHCIPFEIDDIDYQLIANYHWTAFRSKSTFYIQANSCSRGNITKIRLHRLLMNPKAGCVVDHIDGDGTNNKRSNLRICTNQQNSFNSRLSKRNKSGFKGVYFANDRKKWTAQVNYGRKTKHLGTFNSPEEAYRAYCLEIKNTHGEYAPCNCPPGMKEVCSFYGCPFDTALDAPDVVVGRSSGLIGARGRSA